MLDGLSVDNLRGFALAGGDEEAAEFEEVGEVGVVEREDAEVIFAGLGGAAELGEKDCALDEEFDFAMLADGICA